MHTKHLITTDDDETEVDEGQEWDKDIAKKQSQPWRESTTTAPVLDKDVKIGRVSTFKKKDLIKESQFELKSYQVLWYRRQASQTI